MIKNLIVIPARYASSRFPGKVISDLGGKPVVQHVYESCLNSKKADKVVIATDHSNVMNACLKFTDNVVMTSCEHQSGTDRVEEAASMFLCENVVNIQGDEPFISSDLIDKLFTALEVSNSPMVTAFHKITSEGELNNSNIVKVVIDTNSYAIFFSRSQIPFIRPPVLFSEMDFFRHIGVYGYKSDFLKKYVSMPHSILEKAEQLEQLRVIESGYKIKLIETNDVSIGIDTPEDLVLAKLRLSKNEVM